MEEEKKIGSDYLINLTVDADLGLASSSDKLEDTLDYLLLHEIVKKEMSIRSKLLENVAQRIVNKIFEIYDKLYSVEVKISKLNPPINGNVSAVTILSKIRR